MIETKVIEKFMEDNGLEPYDVFDVDGEFKQCNPLYFNEDLEVRSMDLDSRNLEFFGGKTCLYRLLTGKDHVKHRITKDKKSEVVAEKSEIVAEEKNMKLIWKKNRFDGQKITRLVLTDAYNENRAIATIEEHQLNESEPKLFYVYFTLYFGETISIVHPFKSFEVAKRATLQFIKEEAVERMKELTYIINFIDE
jgi:hypothetical protein